MGGSVTDRALKDDAASEVVVFTLICWDTMFCNAVARVFHFIFDRPLCSSHMIGVHSVVLSLAFHAVLQNVEE